MLVCGPTVFLCCGHSACHCEPSPGSWKAPTLQKLRSWSGIKGFQLKKNIDNFGITNIEVKNKDIKQGIDEDDIDLIFLDLPKPFEIFEGVMDALNVGGWLVVYAPYIDQAETSYRVAKKLGFYNIDIIETLERGLEVRTQGVRPKTRMVGHSGYLMFARKL